MLTHDRNLDQRSIDELERKLRETDQRIRDHLREQDHPLLLMLLKDAQEIEASLTRPPDTARTSGPAGRSERRPS